MNLVDRLSEKHWNDWAEPERFGHRNARWWLNAIADEMEQEKHWSTHNKTMIRWLRAQAKEEE